MWTLHKTEWARFFRPITARRPIRLWQKPKKDEGDMKEILIEVLKYYGLKEVIGAEHNPAIVAMFAEIGYDYITDDETAWCSASLNYFCKKLGYERSKALDARSWLKMPTIVLKPTIGDIVVLWRESPASWKGHVGLFINQDADNVWVLGGNTNNDISIGKYPRDRILGFRQVKKVNDSD